MCVCVDFFFFLFLKCAARSKFSSTFFLVFLLKVKTVWVIDSEILVPGENNNNGAHVNLCTLISAWPQRNKSKFGELVHEDFIVR